MVTALSTLAAIIVIIIFLGLSIFQLLLALGKPYGKMAYGGRQEAVLPTKYRILSGIAILIFLIAMMFVAFKVEWLIGFPFPDFVNLATWFFAFYLVLNTLANATSKSKQEKMYMTPISLIACLSLFIVALGL
jgi:hypothetical protein